ncbi:phage tail protein I [Pseudomonas sp. FSL R10-0056]|uniref:phage tail protein I n=1 Tax=unclassified Pseudomonas TaxID=196821 RepID=UPI001294AF9F|nr:MULTISPECIES: phage tail protein I [unclassified Pseudomonas]MQT65419.1 phage tail protein I [Pseudomonas sp. FSL R10-0056]MQT70854.1 phage tail protein I [Pseudomonas sp. FSL R10-0071]MQU50818.1 phage tail protein I [Pseudomonas sp. FSL A6-1183]
MSDASLLPPNRTTLEQALALVSMEKASLPNVLRRMISPDTCPVALLPWLAIQRSVDRWDPEWSESIKRKVIKDSFEIHKRKGTLGALRRVIEPFADLIDITEWHQLEPMGEPGTFSLSLALFESGLSEQGLADLERMIADTKPISRHLVGLNITYSPTGALFLGGAIFTGDEVVISSAELQFSDEDLNRLERAAKDYNRIGNVFMSKLFSI